MADGQGGAGDVAPPPEKTELEEIQFQMNATTDEVGPSLLDPSWVLCRPSMVHVRSSLLLLVGLPSVVSNKVICSRPSMSPVGSSSPSVVHVRSYILCLQSLSSPQLGDLGPLGPSMVHIRSLVIK